MTSLAEELSPAGATGPETQGAGFDFKDASSKQCEDAMIICDQRPGEQAPRDREIINNRLTALEALLR